MLRLSARGARRLFADRREQGQENGRPRRTTVVRDRAAARLAREGARARYPSYARTRSRCRAERGAAVRRKSIDRDGRCRAPRPAWRAAKGNERAASEAPRVFDEDHRRARVARDRAVDSCRARLRVTRARLLVLGASASWRPERPT